MKKHLTWILFSAFLIIMTGCLELESAGTVERIRIFHDGLEVTGGIRIEKGQTITLKADIGLDPKLASIVWLNTNEEIEIISTGEGFECTIRGRVTGNAEMIVKAWRTGEKEVSVTLPVNVEEAVITDIQLTGLDLLSPQRIGVEETRNFQVQIFPLWAQYNITWEATPSGMVTFNETETSGFGILTITGGLTEGPVTITGTADDADSFQAEFNFTVSEPEPITNLAIYYGTTRITDNNGFLLDNDLPIGVFEEKFLTVKIEPADNFTFFTWTSSNSSNIFVENGMIKGLIADSKATITVMASGLSASFPVQVANPVTGIRIRYDNDDNLQVSNTIWLYATLDGRLDFVNLEASLTPAGIHGDITWETDDMFLNLTHRTGRFNTIEARLASPFETPPITVRVTARNEDNGTRPATAILQVKVLPDEPLWAWDRARDGNAHNAPLKIFGDQPGNGSNIPGNGIPYVLEINDPGTPQPGVGRENDGGFNNNWAVLGRGFYAQKLFDDKLFNLKRSAVAYTEKGLYFNSAPAPAGNGSTVNSTCFIIGSNSNANTTGNSSDAQGNFILGNHVEGAFDFLNERWYADGRWQTRPMGRPIRISVDLEVVQPSGRRFVMFVNNNFTATLMSPLAAECRPLYRPITEAIGTRLTLTSNFMANDFAANQWNGYTTLETALVTLVYESMGGIIYISGIRIEYGTN